MKILLIVMDGLGDKPIPQFKNKTPLEAAETPNFDRLAEGGICGLIDPFKLSKQKYPESDTCHLAIFGYDPKKYYFERGVYEAAGLGIKLKENEVALRVNFGTVGEDLKVVDRRAGRISNTSILVKALSGIKIKGVKFTLKKSYGHRAALILKGNNLSSKISNSDPKKIGQKIKKIISLDKSKDSIFTADVLNEFLNKSHQILKNHPFNKKREKQGLLPANFLLTRGAGQIGETPSFKNRYGLRAGCIAGGVLYKGIANVLGMDLIKVKGANGFPDTNLKGKILAAETGLKKYDFIFLHIKATDSLAEDGNFQGKKDFIERVDRNLKPLFKLKNTLVIVTADHSTCSLFKSHCSDPVPLLIFGNGIDSVKQFSEKACQKGKLGRIKQLNLMNLIAEKTKKM